MQSTMKHSSINPTGWSGGVELTALAASIPSIASLTKPHFARGTAGSIRTAAEQAKVRYGAQRG